MHAWDTAAKYRFYVVQVVIPANPDNPRDFARNRSFGIVAESVVRAIELVSLKWPTARIDAINQHGAVHFFPGL